MNAFSSTGLACEYHNLGKKKKMGEEEEEEEEEEEKKSKKVEMKWGLEHPMEPQDEDRPVKCPMPHSSCLIYVTKNEEDEGKRETKLSERAVVMTNNKNRDQNRKRHHTLTAGGDHILVITPSFPANPNPNAS